MHNHVLAAGLAAFASVAFLVCSPSASPARAGETPSGIADSLRDLPGEHAPSVVYVAEMRFIMGNHASEFGYSPVATRHPVELSAYSIGRYEVTNEEFCLFLNSTGKAGEGDLPWVRAGTSRRCRIEMRDGRFAPEPGYERHPVVTVTWRGALAYCRWLSEQTGRQYDLPSEAQWECAARAGSTTTWPWGNEFDPSRLNWRGSSDPPALAPVGSYPPNAWGLYDMLGNAWEWVADAYDPYFYLYSPLQDPMLLCGECRAPIIRGGSFRDSVEFCRPAYRANLWWSGDYDGVGFRVMRREESSRQRS
jgi:formylglycine-generating enzyme required for sulfatase activity